jgi:hypothetical protein
MESTKARAAGDAEAKYRWDGNGAWTSFSWRLDIVALVSRHRRAGASALTTLSCWRIGVVALVHVGIAALRLGNASVARCERARRSSWFFQSYNRHNFLQWMS